MCRFRRRKFEETETHKAWGTWLATFATLTKLEVRSKEREGMFCGGALGRVVDKSSLWMCNTIERNRRTHVVGRSTQIPVPIIFLSLATGVTADTRTRI